MFLKGIAQSISAKSELSNASNPDRVRQYDSYCEWNSLLVRKSSWNVDRFELQFYFTNKVLVLNQMHCTLRHPLCRMWTWPIFYNWPKAKILQLNLTSTAWAMWKLYDQPRYHTKSTTLIGEQFCVNYFQNSHPSFISLVIGLLPTWFHMVWFPFCNLIGWLVCQHSQ